MNLEERHFVIMSRNSLEGFQQGHFNDLFGLYLFKVIDSGEYGKLVEWCEHPLPAKKFSTEVEAWDFACEIWGEHFTERNMMVVSRFTSFDDEDVLHGIMDKKDAERREAMRQFLNRTVVS